MRKLSLRQAWPQRMKGFAMAKWSVGRALLITRGARGIAAAIAEHLAAVADGRHG